MAKPSTKSLAIRGVALSWLGRGAGFVISFIATPILLNGLSDSSYGLWSMIMSFAAYYAIGDMGMHGATVKYVSEFLAKDDRDALSRFFSTAFSIYLGISALVVLIVSVVAGCWPYFVTVAESELLEVQLAVLFTGLSMALRMATQVHLGVLKGLKRFDLLSALGVVMQILQSVLIISVVWSGRGLLEMSICTLGCAFLDNGIKFYLTRRALPWYRYKMSDFSRDSLSLLAKFGGHGVFRSTINRLMRTSGPLLVGGLINPATAGVFSVADELVRKTRTLSSAVGSVVNPIASELNATEQRGRMLAMIIELPKLMGIVYGFSATVFVMFGSELISLWTGLPDIAERAYPSVCILSAALCFGMFGSGLSAVHVGCGRLGFLTGLAAVGAVAQTGIAAGLLYGSQDITGMAWGIFANAVIWNLSIVMYTCWIYQLSPFSFMFKASIRPALATLPAVSVAAWLRNYHVATSLRELFAQIAVVGLVMAGSAAFVCFDRDRRRDILQSLGLIRANKKNKTGKQRAGESGSRDGEVAAN